MFGVALAIVVAIVVLRPSVRRNAATLVEGKLRLAAAAAQAVIDSEGITAATFDRLNEDPPAEMEFTSGDDASGEPLVVSVAVTGGAWTGAARADSGACYFIRLTEAGETLTGTISGSDCTGAAAARADASGWPDL